MEAAGCVVTLVPAQLKGCRPPGPVMGPVGERRCSRAWQCKCKSLAFACLHTQCFCVHDAPAPTTPQGGIIVAILQTRPLRLRKVRKLVQNHTERTSSDCFGSHAVFLILELGKEKSPRWYVLESQETATKVLWGQQSPIPPGDISIAATGHAPCSRPTERSKTQTLPFTSSHSCEGSTTSNATWKRHGRLPGGDGFFFLLCQE